MLYDRGVRVVPSDLTTPYMCNDNRYKAMIGNLDYFIGYINTSPLSNSMTDTQIRSDESEIAHTHMADAATVSSLRARYFAYLREHARLEQTREYQ